MLVSILSIRCITILLNVKLILHSKFFVMKSFFGLSNWVQLFLLFSPIKDGKSSLLHQSVDIEFSNHGIPSFSRVSNDYNKNLLER